MNGATRLRVLASLVLVWLMLSLVALPGTAYATGETVSGTVTDAQTGAPIAGVTCYLYRLVWKTDTIDGRGYWGRDLVYTVDTSDDGTYIHPQPVTPLFETLPPGNYYMDFRATTDYTNESYDNIHTYGFGSFTFGSAVPFAVIEGAHITGIDAALEKDGFLDVRLTTPTGAALDDAQIAVWVWDVSQQFWWQMAAFTTDSNGRLLTNWGLPGATYRLTFNDPHRRFAESIYGGGLYPAEGADVVIEPGKTTKISAVLGPPSYAVGRVVDAEDNGLCDIRVTAFRYDPYYSQWAWASSSLTDTTGRYALIQTAGVYRYEYCDSAGTPLNSSDDVTIYYPGVVDLASASNVTLLQGGTKVLDDIVISPAAGIVSRVAGVDRYSTAVASSRRAFEPDTCETVVLASGVTFPDALSASSLVGAVEGSLLLTRPHALPAVVTTEIQRLGATEVLIIGGPGAIGNGVVDQLNDIGISVRRVFGPDRYATSVAVAREVEDITGSLASEVIVARGDVFADAVAASGVGSGNLQPVLLTRPNVLPASVRTYLTDTTPQTVVLLGGSAAISPAIQSAITVITKDVAGARVVRVSGPNRYSTAARFAQWCRDSGWTLGTHVAVATGASFPDALAAGAAVGRDHGCVLLTRKAEFHPDPRIYVRGQRSGLSSAIIYGGPGVVSPAALSDVGTAIDQD